MAVELKVGETVCVQKTGMGKNGRWVLAKKTNDEAKDSIQIWADNPDAIADGVIGCEVMNIMSVKKTAHEYPKGSGKWFSDTIVNATLKPIGDVSAPVSGFSQLSEEDCPF